MKFHLQNPKGFESKVSFKNWRLHTNMQKLIELWSKTVPYLWRAFVGPLGLHMSFACVGFLTPSFLRSSSTKLSMRSEVTTLRHS